MKILHIAEDRSAALVAARVLHGIAQNVALTWAPSASSGIEWLQGNRDAAAVVVEVQDRGCAPFLRQLRGLGLTTPAVVVTGASRLDTALDMFNSGADGYVVAGPSLDAALPRAVAAAIDNELGRRQLLTQTLTELEVERQRAEQQPGLIEEARQQTEQRTAHDLAASAAAKLVEIESRYLVSLRRQTRICMSLQRRLFELEGALRKADERHASDTVAAADQLARRHEEFTASLTQAAQARDALTTDLSAATAALDEARQARSADAVAAAEHLRLREAELRAEIAAVVAERTALRQALADAEAAHQDTRERAAVDLASANERQAALEDLLAQETDRRKALDRELTAALADRDAIDVRRTQDLAAAAGRERAVEERLAAETERRIAVDRQLAAAHSARYESDQRHASELADAQARIASLQTTHDAVLTEHAAARAAFEQRLTGAKIEADRVIAAKAEEIRRLQQEQEALRGVLWTTQDQLEQVHVSLGDERDAHERTRISSDAELRRLAAEYDQIRESFDRLQSSFQTLEQIAGEHAAHRTRLEAVLAERDSELSAQAERHRLTEQRSQDALTELRHKLREAVETGGSEIARLQQEIGSLRRELESTRTHAEALRGVADRVPDLQQQLERSRNERRRQFERAPHALCLCSPSGAIVDANHSFVTLLGFRRVDELRDMDFLTAAHDSAGDLAWLLTRARTTRKTETVETHWKTGDGRRLVVRLQALATVSGSIEIVAEDVTAVRSLEDRLRQAQRMEAVGRLASEVAVTCEALLSDVARGAHDWLDTAGSDTTQRRYVERLLTDVTRAASFLRQLGTYGNEQVRALEPVSAQRVLRDLAPVLKRLVGEQIDLVLPKSAGSFNVDVEAERLERVLINVASYARQRMSAGGQVRIDLAVKAVGRRFAARYSNVRPGDHVLITVTELPAIAEPRSDPERRLRSSDTPGVDVGVLVDLIASCGGHLWLEAQPAGNMVLKIHLPKAAVPATENRTGRLSRWFRHAPTANARA